MTNARSVLLLLSMSCGSVGLHAQAVGPNQGAAYVGSTACKTCHPSTYERWSKTRMANVVTDPKLHPEIILPDLTKADPLVTFKKEDIALVYGTKWKQRYFQKVGDDYFPLGAQWDVSHQIWRAYNVAMERIGGPSSTRKQTPRARPVRSVTAATPSTTISRPRRRPK